MSLLDQELQRKRYRPGDWQVLALMVVVLAILVVVWRGTRALVLLVRRRGAVPRGDEVLMVMAAAAATGVASTGMWRFAGVVLHMSGPLRGMLFGFLELAVVTCAVRARRGVAETGHAGIDGMAVWALTLLSGSLSAMDARTMAEAVCRLAAPLVAAFLWERGLAVDRRKAGGGRGIHWRITLERVLVFLGLADATDRTTGDVDAHRRLTRLALAALDVRASSEGGVSTRRRARAVRRLNRAMRAAVRHSGLGVNPTQVEVLLAHLAALKHAAELADLELPAPWDQSRLKLPRPGLEATATALEDKAIAEPAGTSARRRADNQRASSSTKGGAGRRAAAQGILKEAAHLVAAGAPADGTGLLRRLREADAETSQVVRLAFILTRDPGEAREQATQGWVIRARAWLHSQHVPYQRRELTRIRDEQLRAAYSAVPVQRQDSFQLVTTGRR